jgi:BirA family transcriptional regulator, biotin operon repressor / biotin---[acetyl-CoA-carboxylase] ligase
MLRLRNVNPAHCRFDDRRQIGSQVAQPVRSIVLEEVGSTNAEAFKRAEAGERGPLWIVARRQTQGRGRSGRSWGSEPGNLYASLLQTIACPQSAVHQISLLAGVAVIDAIRAAAGGARLAGLRLKWPNDVLIGQAKCAGILPECVSGADGRDVTAVVGIGINLAWHPANLGRPATHMAAHGVDVTPDVMLQALALAMQKWIDTWQGGAGFARVRAAWLERAGPVGEAATVDTGAERIAGTFLDLDADGALLLRDTHGLQRRVTYGDVTLAEPAREERG